MLLMAFALWSAKAAKAFGIVVFSSGEEAEQITVSDGAESFSAITEVRQAVKREDVRLLQTV